MCIAGGSSQSLRCRLAAVARPAQAFKVQILIGTPMCLRYYVIHCGSGYRSTAPQTLLADVVITLEDAGAANSPVATVAALVPALTLLVYFPTCVLVFGTVA